MSRYIELHPVNPQARLVEKVVDTLRDGGLVAYPTDSGYALACAPGNKEGLDRIRTARGARESAGSPASSVPADSNRSMGRPYPPPLTTPLEPLVAQVATTSSLRARRQPDPESTARTRAPGSVRAD